MIMRIQFDAIVMQKNGEIEVMLVEIFEINCACFWKVFVDKNISKMYFCVYC